MIIYCPKIDDDHLSGPHQIVIPVSTVVKHIGGKLVFKREIASVTGAEFVICANCDHWVKRVVQWCSCYCHREAHNH